MRAWKFDRLRESLAVGMVACPTGWSCEVLMAQLRNTRWICLLLLSASTLLLASGCTKKSKAEGHLKRADAYFAAKDFPRAEIEYLNVLKLDRVNVEAVKHLATIYFDQGKIQQAVPYLLGVRELDKNDLGARLKLAQIFLSAGRLPDARKEAIEILDRDPKNDEAITVLADSSATPADLSDTLQRLEKLEAQAAGRAAWHLAMAGISLRKADLPAAEVSLGKALSLEPQSSQVQVAWAMIYWLKKDLEKADQFFKMAADLAPLNAAVCLRRAEFKLNTGSPKEGREILEQFAAKVPDSTPVLLYLARLDFDGQKYPECAKIIGGILARDPGNYQARVLHSSLTRVQGKPEDAVKEAEELKRVYDGSAEVTFDLALAYLKNRDPVKAVASVQDALKLNPNLTQAALLKAELLVQKGDSATALPLLQELVQKHPEITRAQLLLGGAYTAQGKLDEALKLYTAMEEKFPKVPDVPFIIGMTLRQQPGGKGNAEARKAFERAAALSPNDLLVTYQLVDLDLLDKAYPAATERVAALLEKMPKSGGAKVIEARIFLAQNNLKDAEVSLKQALEWEPNGSTPYDLLTQIYLSSNRLPEALANMEEMLKKKPDNVPVMMQMAVMLEKQGDLNKAVATYENLLKIAPDFVPALNNLAFLLCDKLGKPSEALPLASKARELAPQALPIADTLGWVYFRQREYPRALALLQECAPKLPEEPEVQFHLGMAHYMMGQEEPARLAFQRALERKQDFPGRDQAEKRLALLGLDPNAPDPAAIASLEELTRQQPDDLPALLRLGGIYERTGVPDKARQAYEDARKVNPGSAPVLFALARLYSTDLKNPQQALALASEARKLAPEDAAIAHLLGRLAFQSGDHVRAANLLQESARKLPDHPEVIFDLAQAVYAVGRVNEAGETMRRAVGGGGLKGENALEAQSFLEMLDLAKDSGRQLAAEAEVQQALKARPNLLPALVVAALIQEQSGNVPEAKEAFEKILVANPQFAPARKQLAEIYTDQGDQQKAQEQATKAREVLTDDPELTKILGKIAYRRGDFPGAILFLRESSLKRPEDGELFYFLGMAQNQRKAKEESKLALQRALTLSPGAAFVSEAKKALAELEK